MIKLQITAFGRTQEQDIASASQPGQSSTPAASSASNAVLGEAMNAAVGSRVDRHEHIGDGFLGRETFWRLVNDRRFRDLPMLLETPKTEGRSPNRIEIDPLDRKNLKLLRALAR